MWVLIKPQKDAHVPSDSSVKTIVALSSQPAKSLKSNTTLEEGVFVESAFNMRCHIVNNTLFHIAFSAILPAGNATTRLNAPGVSLIF